MAIVEMLPTNNSIPMEDARVAVATEALRRIKAGLFFAQRGSLLGGFRGSANDPLLVCAEGATGCALGALIVGVLASENNRVLTRREWYALPMGVKDIEKYFIEKYFSEEQRNLIEYAFEKWGAAGNLLPGVDMDRLGDQDAVKEDLIAVLQNIIDNKGTFVPQEAA